jgi:hypothetical protein
VLRLLQKENFLDTFINPPKNIPLILRLGIWLAERTTDKRTLPARILAWYPQVCRKFFSAQESNLATSQA